MTKLLFAVFALEQRFRQQDRAQSRELGVQIIKASNIKAVNQYSLQNGIWRCDTCVPKIAINADGRDYRVITSAI
jgi:hypothetical protein